MKEFGAETGGPRPPDDYSNGVGGLVFLVMVIVILVGLKWC